MIKAPTHICSGWLMLLLFCGTGLSQGIPTASTDPQIFDLDIDSDNNNELTMPDGSEWEDHIEDHAFSIGKLIETGASRWTPVIIRLNTGAFKQTSGSPASLGDLRVKFEFENPSGKVRCWSRPQAGNASPAAEPLAMGQDLPFEELSYDAATGTARIWLEALEAAPGIGTKIAIDQNGRPNMFLRATLSRIPDQEPLTDKVKYLPVDPGTFFPTFVTPENRPLRNSFPATLVNGAEGRGGTAKPVAPAQSETYGFRLVTEDELTNLLKASKLNAKTQSYVLDVVHYKLRSYKDIGRHGVYGFRAGLYRDYNSGAYTLAFQHSRKDHCLQLYKDLDPNVFESAASLYVNRRFTACLLLSVISEKKHAMNLTDLQLAGAGVGGDLAVFATLGSGAHADIYDTTPFPAEMMKLILTRYEPSRKERIEPVPGSLNRMEHADDLVTSHRITETPYGIEDGPFPIQPDR